MSDFKNRLTDVMTVKKSNQSFQEPKIIKKFDIKCIPFLDRVEDGIPRGESICFDKYSDYVIANNIMKDIQDFYKRSYPVWRRTTLFFMV